MYLSPYKERPILNWILWVNQNPLYYFSIDDLEEELAQVGKFLDSLCEKGEVICEIIPNIGLVHNSIILGPGYQGVKGFVIIVQKNK